MSSPSNASSSSAVSGLYPRNLPRNAGTGVPAPRRLRRPSLPTAAVGPFSVVDAPVREVVEHLSNPHPAQTVAYALHVGGLNTRTDTRFVAAMNRADLVYADGKSVELVARAAGASRIERAATTDIGLPVLAALSRKLGRPARVAMIGARPGVAELAAQTIEQEAGTETVFTEHGYHQDWTDRLKQLRAVQPDAVIVGLGMPLEAVWVDEHRTELPDSLILTCGGWLGFLAGNEQRAPQYAQRAGAEWLYRLRQQPLHLGPRYARGLASFTNLYLRARLSRTPA